jgi:hypothetical protein
MTKSVNVKKTAEELEAWGKRLSAERKFVPIAHNHRDIMFWVKEQTPFIRSEFFKDVWEPSGQRYGR